MVNARVDLDIFWQTRIQELGTEGLCFRSASKTRRRLKVCYMFTSATATCCFFKVFETSAQVHKRGRMVAAEAVGRGQTCAMV